MLDNKDKIRMSIALVTRNRPESLERCLKSLRSQSIQPFEVVISDDSDPDLAGQTESVASRWDCLYIKGPRRGLYANRNYSALACKGTHIRTMDDDHEFPNQHIENCLLAIQSDPQSVWIIGEYLHGKTIGKSPHFCPGQLHPRGFSYLPENTQNCWAIADGASIYPQEIFERGLRFVEAWKFGSAYLEWGSRLYYLGYRIRHLESTYIIHHYDPQNRSFSNKIWEQSSMFFAMRCHSFIYQSNFKNKLLFYFEICKQLIISPSVSWQALQEYIPIYNQFYREFFLLNSHKFMSQFASENSTKKKQ